MDDPQTNYAETATGTGTDSGSGVKTKENQKATVPKDLSRLIKADRRRRRRADLRT
jgi:hypothetical protein